jgi:hypothetical protein
MGDNYPINFGQSCTSPSIVPKEWTQRATRQGKDGAPSCVGKQQLNKVIVVPLANPLLSQSSFFDHYFLSVAFPASLKQWIQPDTAKQKQYTNPKKYLPDQGHPEMSQDNENN